LNEINENLEGNPKWLWIGGYSQGTKMTSTVALTMEQNIGGILLMFHGYEPNIDIDKIHEEKK